MKRVDEAGLTAYLDKRDRKDSRILQPAFEGKVSAVKGSAGSYQIQVIRSAETSSDGHWYAVQTTGQVPVVGDRVQLQWQDDQIAYMTSILSAPRVVDQHNYYISLYWTGTATLPNGWTRIPFNNVEKDLASMSNGVGGVAIQIPGQYLITLRSGVNNGSVDTTVGLYLNGALKKQGERSDSSGPTECELVTVRPLLAGDKLEGYIYTGSTSGSNQLQSGQEYTWMEVFLLGQSAG